MVLEAGLESTLPRPTIEIEMLESVAQKTSSYVALQPGLGRIALRQGLNPAEVNQMVSSIFVGINNPETAKIDMVLPGLSYAMDILRSGMITDEASKEAADKLLKAERVVSILSVENVFGLQLLVNRLDESNRKGLYRDRGLITALSEQYEFNERAGLNKLITVGGDNAAKTTLRSKLWQRLKPN